MRLGSTSERIKNEELSLAAIIETVVAVLAYWWVAIRYETYTPLIIGAGVAWLLLLRSEESVVLGARWFGAWEGQWQGGRRNWSQVGPQEHQFISIVAILAVVLACLASYVSAKRLLVEVTGWK